MNISITFKNFEPSEHLKGYANKRFNKLGRFVGKGVESELALIMAVDKHRQKAEALLTFEGAKITAATDSSDMYATVDMLLDKMEEQVKRHNEKKRSQRNPGTRGEMPGMAAFEEKSAPAAGKVESAKISNKPMFPEDAERYLEETKQELVVFLNAETQRQTVMYRNSKGKVRLIDPEFD